MSDIEQKRDFVGGLYSGPGWKKKVAKMGDDQIVAIYLRETNKAKERHTKPKPDLAPKKESGTEDDLPF